MEVKYVVCLNIFHGSKIKSSVREGLQGGENLIPTRTKRIFRATARLNGELSSTCPNMTKVDDFRPDQSLVKLEYNTRSHVLADAVHRMNHFPVS